MKYGHLGVRKTTYTNCFQKLWIYDIDCLDSVIVLLKSHNCNCNDIIVLP